MKYIRKNLEDNTDEKIKSWSNRSNKIMDKLNYYRKCWQGYSLPNIWVVKITLYTYIYET